MSELSNRVEAQRQILKTVNSIPWQTEHLFALSAPAIQRWALANDISREARLVKLLKSASAEIFVMANHSDDPIAGIYTLTRQRVDCLNKLIRAELVEQLAEE